VFEKTFHYTDEGWNKFTWSFAWFFVFTAVMNEVVRQTFKDTQFYNFLGYQMNGVNIWILFKIAFIMPVSGLYAWFLTQLMQKHRIDDPSQTETAAAHEPRPSMVAAAVPRELSAIAVEARAHPTRPEQPGSC
jgi:intracellular septation protein